MMINLPVPISNVPSISLKLLVFWTLIRPLLRRCLKTRFPLLAADPKVWTASLVLKNRRRKTLLSLILNKLSKTNVWNKAMKSFWMLSNNIPMILFNYLASLSRRDTKLFRLSINCSIILFHKATWTNLNIWNVCQASIFRPSTQFLLQERWQVTCFT